MRLKMDRIIKIPTTDYIADDFYFAFEELIRRAKKNLDEDQLSDFLDGVETKLESEINSL